MAVLQSLRQQSVRDETGTALDYNSDWSALFDDAGIAAGPWNGRLLAWINDYLGTSYTNLPGAMQAFAVDQGFANWSGMGTFVAASSPSAQILTLAAADGWAAVYDPTNPDTRTLRTSGADSFVSAIADGLGNFPTLVQATEANQPKLTIGAFGSLDAVLSDGAGEMLSVDITDVPQPFSFVALGQWMGAATGVNAFLFRTDFSGRGFQYRTNTTWQWNLGSGIVSAADSNQHVLAGVANGASSKIRVDGVVTVTNNAGANSMIRVDYAGSDAGISSWNGLVGPLLLRADADEAAIGRMEALLGSFF